MRMAEPYAEDHNLTDDTGISGWRVWRSMKKKLVIVGGGIAGLSTGVYALANGFEAEIYEMHRMAGGECTGWDRGDYHFDGCIHWLMGCKRGTNMNRVWRFVGALDDSVDIIVRESFGTLVSGNSTVTLYTDPRRLREHLLEVSLEDRNGITELCGAIEGLRGMEIPWAKPFDMMGPIDMVKMGLSMRPYLRYMKYQKMTVGELAEGFRSPLIRTLLLNSMPAEYSAMSLVSTLASLSTGDSGWPRGGSRALARRVEKRFLDSGGKILFGKRASRILVDNGLAQGVEFSDGSQVLADAVVTATDGYEALYGLLQGGYLSKLHERMFSDTEGPPVQMSFQAWAGVAADLSGEPESVSLQLDEPVRLGGDEHTRIWLMHYSYDRSMAPPGHSVVTSFFPTSDFDWWRELYQEKEAYRAEKDRIASVVKDAIENQYSAAEGRVGVMDVATPMTYVRYCNAWRGAWMSWISTPDLPARYLPMRLRGLKGFVMAGQWIMPPGGLPVAALSGRWAVQHLCAAERRPFVSEE